jgi:hypothetical protein
MPGPITANFCRKRRGVGLIAIKPLAAGSIVKLDPSARGGTQPERDFVQLYHAKYRPLLPAVVKELTRSLERLPEESLCQAAMPGMFGEETLDDNYSGLTRHLELTRDERAALDAAGRAASAAHGRTASRSAAAGI